MKRYEWWLRGFAGVLSGLIPLLLVGTAVRVLLTDAYLSYEYERPHFPEDMFGFTLEERLVYASLAVEYLVDNYPVDFLAAQTFPDGETLYNERELRHMVDVQQVVVGVLRLYAGLMLLFLVGCGFLFVQVTTRNILRSALIRGAMLTLGIMAALILIAALNWDIFFVQFHQVFFEAGTWRFDYSDTLIRLFPEQFWFDAALAIGFLTAAGAFGLGTLAWLWKPGQATGAAQQAAPVSAGDS